MKIKGSGFTIVELLIVIVVIGILASISLVAYNGVQTKAKNSRRDSDIALLERAILNARTNTGNHLVGITGYGMTSYNCQRIEGNPGLVEPRTLPQNHACWNDWRSNLNKIGAAAGLNLTSLHAGDPNGNPYYLNENEGENNGGNYCLADHLGYFTGNGVNYIITRDISAARGATC
jgi:prepilin-type N-terminal cleavage/methylation domain-containing protein